MSEENSHDADIQDTSDEMRQLMAIANEIDNTQTLPPTPEEEAEQLEGERVQSINDSAVAIADEQYLAAVSGGVDALWTLAAPNWKLEEAELAPMAQLTKMVIDKHFPNLTENAGPEVMLGMVALSVITSRVAAGIPPRGEIKPEGGEDE
ncbi:hypothetical protein [Vibrio neptunius]|uniref:hypothetical protein n=1 Tax=Vibrio neptunius TaxID=170651 RepID=UPI003CE54378